MALNPTSILVPVNCNESSSMCGGVSTNLYGMNNSYQQQSHTIHNNNLINIQQQQCLFPFPNDFMNVSSVPINFPTAIDTDLTNRNSTTEDLSDNTIPPVVAALLDLSDHQSLAQNRHPRAVIPATATDNRPDMTYSDFNFNHFRRQLEGTEILLQTNPIDSSKEKKRNRIPLVQRLLTLPRCDVCDERIELAKLKSHLKACEHRKQFYCELCGEGFNQHLNYMLHVAIHDTSRDALQCPACDRQFSRLASFRCHLTLHRVDDTVNCDVCQEEFTYYTQLKRHVRLVHNESSAEQFEEESNVTFCKDCGIMMTNKDQIKEHRMTHRKIKESLRLVSRKRRPKPQPASTTAAAGTNNRFRNRLDYLCPTCGKNFSKRNALERHELIHTGQRPYICKVCGKTFNQKGALMFHEAVHADEKPFKCQLCDARFTQRGNLRKHVQRLHPANLIGRPALRCPLCPCIFRSVQPLNVHLSRRHNESLTNEEVTDTAASLDVVAVNAGLSTTCNTDEILRSAVNCMASAEESEQLGDNLEINRKTSDLLKDVLSKSGLCNDIVVEPLTQSHETDRIDQPQSSSTEQNTDRSITELRTVAESAEGISSGGRQLAAISQKLLKKATAELLKKHVHRIRITGDSFYGSQLQGVKVRVENGRKYWKCSVCTYEFSRGSDLVRHMRRHTGEKPYPCSMCGQSFSLRTTLQRHLRRHLGISDARCYICLKQLSTNSSLRKHMRVHTRQPFRCPNCLGQFKSKNLLQKHLKKVHPTDSSGCPIEPILTTDHLKQPLMETAEGHIVEMRKPGAPKDYLSSTMRPFCCNTCGALFRRAAHLKDHIQSHSGYRQYHCRQCGRTFMSSRSLKEHLKKHSGRRPYYCAQCPKSFVSSGALKRHSVVHSDLQPFICPYCSRRFKRGVLCRKHIRLRHSQERWPSPTAMLFETPIPDMFVPPSYYENGQMSGFEDIYSIAQQDYGQNEQSTMIDANNWYGYDPRMETIENGQNIQQQQMTNECLDSIVALRPNESDAILNDTCGQGLTMTNCELSSVIADVLNSDSLMGPPLPPTEPTTSVPANSQVDFNPSITSLRPPPPYNSTKADHMQRTTVVVNEEEVVINNFLPNDERSSKFDCAVCGARCETMEDLLIHLKDPNQYLITQHTLHHYQCPICNQPYNGQKRIIRHLMADHTQHKSQTGMDAKLDQSVMDAMHNKRPKERLKTTATSNDRQCTYCAKEFKKPSDLIRHVRIHTGEKPYPCNLCGCRFRVKSTLSTHLKTHDTESTEVASCTVCGKVFMSRGALKVHNRQHTNECPYKCTLCPLSFRTSGQRQTHVQSLHEGKKRRQSAKRAPQFTLDCLPATVTRPQGNERVQLGTQNSAFTPVIRSEPASAPPVVASLMAERLSLTVQPDPENGSLRVDVQPLPVGATLSTTTCPAQFIIETPLLKDLQEKGMVLKIPLPEPEFAPGTELSVDPHQLLQSLDRFNETESTVDIVRQPTTSHVDFVETQSQQSTQLVVEQTFIVECLICDLHFDTPDESRSHFTSADHETAVLSMGHAIYQQDRGFSCECCPKSFDRQTKLDRHMRVHTRDRPFSCSHCNQKYSQKSSLQMHIRSAHENRRAHSCPHCPKNFVHKWNLSKHLKVHSKREILVINEPTSAVNVQQKDFLWHQPGGDDQPLSLLSL